MSATIANINGANVKRLTIEQFGSNLGHTVLTRPLLSETAKFDVQIEDFFVSSDIPIYPADTHVFTIVETTLAHAGDAWADQNQHDCVVGPVYNWLDFAYQIQEFLDSVADQVGEVSLEGSLIPQKNLSFKANAEFWGDKIIYFSDQFAEIFENSVVFLRQAADGSIVTANTVPKVLMIAANGTFTATVDLDYIGGDICSESKSRMDLFENRHRLRIDSVLPLPHELFCVGRLNESAKVSHRYTFMEFDFPKETLYTKVHIQNAKISDNQDLSQILRTGIFRLIKPSLHSGLKKMLPGQSQDHRYELFLIRKVIKDGIVELREEKWPMSGGDFFRLVLLFTQEV